jgi:hypothetical protein
MPTEGGGLHAEIELGHVLNVKNVNAALASGQLGASADKPLLSGAPEGENGVPLGAVSNVPLMQ